MILSTVSNAADRSDRARMQFLITQNGEKVIEYLDQKVFVSLEKGGFSSVVRPNISLEQVQEAVQRQVIMQLREDNLFTNNMNREVMG